MLHKGVMGVAVAALMTLSMTLGACTLAVQPEADMAEPTPVSQEESGATNPATPPAAEFVLPDGTRCIYAQSGFSATNKPLSFDGKDVRYNCEPSYVVKDAHLVLLGEPEVAGPTEYNVELGFVNRVQSTENDGFGLMRSEVISFTAWAITLADGRICLHAGFGATMGFEEGKRLNYTCDKGDSSADEVGLMGELVAQGDGVWLAQIDEIGRTASGFEQLSSTQVAVATISGAEVVASGDGGKKPVEDAAAVENELIGPTWQWIETAYSNDSLVTSRDPSRYTLTFHADGTLTAQVDCNQGSGTYTVDGASLTLGPLATTRMGCPADSQDAIFAQDLAAVGSYVIEDGRLFLTLVMDGGIMEFAPAE
jgi:heat shock protein HslJ